MAKNQASEEEVDLGSLLLIIKNGFKSLFNFIRSIFREGFHFFISLLLFLKSNAKKIACAAIIGAIVGACLEYFSEKKYGSDLLLQPNFRSARQLYNNINYYNDLVEQKDTLLLAKIFDISIKQATSLKEFTISPIRTENDILTAYDQLVLSLDTTSVRSYSFEIFKKMFTDYDYKIHHVHVEATKSDIFGRLEPVIIESIVSNSYFKKVKTLTNESLNRTDQLLRKNLIELDTLLKVYRKVLLEEAKKETKGTSIDLGGDKKETKELELFQTYRKVDNDLKNVSIERSEKSQIVNVISGFQTVGYEIKDNMKNYIFILGIAFAGIILAIILLKQLNHYLEEYKSHKIPPNRTQQ